eukprot:CAMPEP_0201540406 /NCGR_PEP_ID=MMETSP0161_2-20130828/70926_1 /ASSEMBLY_ACC=CAM_ASM_000251 /TAXON_ID=180227 /ORGANISM="Neoparamoeba aestuarina, Strain SoJaBio B1-5/56/2" /LENGTH=246 /DNA_ID=CAMNT_0047947873 /DNA_START=1325 /DNA_END=2061 /DNA_ORIENTATION=-
MTVHRDKLGISDGKEKLSVHLKKPATPESVKSVISTAKSTRKKAHSWLKDCVSNDVEEAKKVKVQEVLPASSSTPSSTSSSFSSTLSNSGSSPVPSIEANGATKTLSEQDIEMLLSHFPTKTYAPEELIQEKGTEINRIGFVLKGSLKVTVEHDGNPLNLPDVQQGEIVGEIGAILHTLCSADLAAGKEGCTLIVVPSEFLFDVETNSSFRVRVYFSLLKLMWQRIIRQEKEQVQEWMKKLGADGG